MKERTLPPMPAHLQNRPDRRSLINDANRGLGTSRPPRISTESGQFKVVIAGTEYPLPTSYLDCIIIDVNSHTSRVLYPTPYVKGSSPICFSDNGVGPSVDSQDPQSPLCEGCKQNQIGQNETFHKKKTTFCSAAKKLAVLLLGDPSNTVFEYVVKPGSFINFKAYNVWVAKQMSPMTNRPADLFDFVTRITSDPDKSFTFDFEAVDWVDERMMSLIA